MYSRLKKPFFICTDPVALLFRSETPSALILSGKALALSRSSSRAKRAPSNPLDASVNPVELQDLPLLNKDNSVLSLANASTSSTSGLTSRYLPNLDQIRTDFPVPRKSFLLRTSRSDPSSRSNSPSDFRRRSTSITRHLTATGSIRDQGRRRFLGRRAKPSQSRPLGMDEVGWRWQLVYDPVNQIVVWADAASRLVGATESSTWRPFGNLVPKRRLQVRVYSLTRTGSENMK
ncbi:unnamed protein product [Protopolystoma xenopodis]|uniref:Uncharacterized protein n=1 Tax=Protopolystoma xenopodis TaxID=117903 RepID=A0A448WKU8_9PLAT|nr:unnamed protein product [Protopolystoma xenopodis]